VGNFKIIARCGVTYVRTYAYVRTYVDLSCIDHACAKMPCTYILLHNLSYNFDASFNSTMNMSQLEDKLAFAKLLEGRRTRLIDDGKQTDAFDTYSLP
jgi:hypothetical protein